MKKPWLLKLAGIAALGVLGFCFIVWWTTPADLISKQSADRIVLGMTLDDAVAIVGIPPRDHTLDGRELVNLRWWFCDRGVFSIILDENGKIEGKRYSVESWRQKSRRWLRIDPS